MGMNPWVCNRVESVLGAKPHEYLPERWLQKEGEPDADYTKRHRNMVDSEMSFGYGKRACTGKPVAILTATKLLSSFFNRYDVSLFRLVGRRSKLIRIRSSWSMLPSHGRSRMSGSPSSLTSTSRLSRKLPLPTATAEEVLRCRFQFGADACMHD